MTRRTDRRVTTTRAPAAPAAASPVAATLGAIAWLALTLATAGYQVGRLDGPSELRVLVALAFVVLAPGYGWVRLVGVADPVARWTLSAVLGTSLSLLVAFAMAITERWQPTTGFAVLAAIGGLGVLAHLAAALRGPRAATPPAATPPEPAP